MKRLVRTRMLGVVGGVPGNRAPIPMYAQHGREFVGCGTRESSQSPVFSSDFLTGVRIPNE